MSKQRVPTRPQPVDIFSVPLSAASDPAPKRRLTPSGRGHSTLSCSKAQWIGFGPDFFLVCIVFLFIFWFLFCAGKGRFFSVFHHVFSFSRKEHPPSLTSTGGRRLREGLRQVQRGWRQRHTHNTPPIHDTTCSSVRWHGSVAAARLSCGERRPSPPCAWCCCT